MRIFADLHIHSPYSRATSKDLRLEKIYVWAQKKGLGLVGTGDFTHPEWTKEILEKLEPAEEGLWRLKTQWSKAVEPQIPPSCKGEVRFVLQTEISTIYKKGGRVRKVHHLVLLPDQVSMDKLVWRLEKIGNLGADGRPILGLDSRDLLELVLEASERAILVPAHVWTPWFSLFGSNSGFDSIEECYGDLACHIRALETGLSSDPAMNRRWSQLDSLNLVSNSDAHSPSRLGREATVLDIPLSYEGLKKAIETSHGLLGTVEFFPEEGKYHLDGHRGCGIRMTPKETRENKGLCPRCGKPLTVGVLHRVEELCDRPHGELGEVLSPCWRLIPLEEILSELYGSGKTSKKVESLYEGVVGRFGPEIQFLMEFPLEGLEEAGMGPLAEAIERMRNGRVIVDPGFDGQYGRIRLFDERELVGIRGQMSLMNLPETTSQRGQVWFHMGDFPKVSESRGAHGSLDGEDMASFLDPRQREAVESEARALLIIAGPGTGKTRVLTHRIAHLMARGSLDPEKVLAVTFTQRAATEMRERLEGLLGLQGCGARIRVQTLHAWGFELIRRFWRLMGLRCEPSVADEAARSWALDAALKKIGGGLKELDRGKALESISRSKEVGAKGRMGEVLEIYNEELREAGLVDYEDLLLLPLQLLREREDIRAEMEEEIGHLFVDEFQDLNPLQMALMELLLGPKACVTVVGDPDQSIYGFRGASPENFLGLMRKVPEVVPFVLEANYRSKAEIVRGALGLITHNEPLFQRSLVPRRPDGGAIYLHLAWSEREEGLFVAKEIERLLRGTSHLAMRSIAERPEESPVVGFGDIAVLCRVHHLLPRFQEILEAHGIPCMRWAPEDEGSSSLDLILWALRKVAGMVVPPRAGWKQLEDELQKMVREGPPPAPRDILPSVIDKLERFRPSALGAQKSDGSLTRLLEASQRWSGDLRSFLDYWSMISFEDQPVGRADKVSLMTVHGAKGLEFSVVFVVGCEEGIFPLFLEAGSGDLLEERRLFFVAMTRAKDLLYLTASRRRTPLGGIKSWGPSRFLREIPQELITPIEPQRAPTRPRQLNLF